MYILIQEFIFITKDMFGTHLKIGHLISIHKRKKKCIFWHQGYYGVCKEIKSPIKNYDIYVMMSVSKIMSILSLFLFFRLKLQIIV